ncbi:MAG: DUF368 domain-containing protein [Planctomycetota bacterium]
MPLTVPKLTIAGIVTNMTTEANPEQDTAARDDVTHDGSSVMPRGGDLVNVLRGFCMGAADTVPGVSGGTVALILGHYDRLIAAISNIDTTLLGMVCRRQWSAVAQKIDLRFLIALGLGVVSGIIALAGLLHWLLHHHVNETFAVFFGLVLASVWVVRRNVERWSPASMVALLAGVLIAIGISQLPTADAELSLVFLFFSASIAICAMILPGISGAFLLLLLGVYEPVIGMIKRLVSGDVSVDLLLRLTVFALGCLFGLLAFSRLLKYLLSRHRDVTMASLIGLMIGSVARLYPLQQVTPETAGLKLKYQQFEFVSPSEYAGSVPLLIILAVIAGAVVLLADRAVGHQSES